MAARKVRFGIVGAGNVAEIIYLPNIARLPQVEVVALCDTVEAQAKRMQAKFQVPACYTSIEEMLQHADIEAVAIFTPIPTHAALALKAIAAGKHVYVEKPVATNMADADRIVQEADRARVKVACAPPTILNPRVKLIKDVLDQGAIGKVCWARAHASHVGPGQFMWRTMDVTWFYKPGGGPLFDIGVYALQELVYILGPARRVTAFTGTANPQIVFRSGPKKGETCTVEVDDCNLILLDFGNDTWAFVDATYCVWAAQGPRREFYGRNGTLTVNPPGAEQPFQVFREDFDLGIGGWLEPTFGGLGIEISMQKERQRFVEGLRLAVGVEHLADCILEDRPPLISAERARHILEIMLGVTESGRTGRAVSLKTTV